jgi:hypothetical protein
MNLLSLEQFSHRFGDNGEVRNESTIITHETHKTTNLVYGLGSFPIHHLLYFARIYGYAFFGNSVPQEFHTIQPKFAFGAISIEFALTQML